MALVYHSINHMYIPQKSRRPSFLISLYWSGISIRAWRAKVWSGFPAANVKIRLNSTNWKLSNFLAGNRSSNSYIISQGPSPTPTIIIESGHFEASTIASLVGRSLVTWPSATITRMWYCKKKQWYIVLQCKNQWLLTVLFRSKKLAKIT